MLGSHCAMSPGARTMPAAMVLPMAAAMPNHTPRTFRRPPLERAEVSMLPAVAGVIGGVSAVVLDASVVLDNGGLRGVCNDAAMIVGVRKNASWKSLGWKSRQAGTR